MHACSPGCLQPSPYGSIFSPGLILNTAVSASQCLVLQGLVCPGAEHLISPAGIDLEPGCFWRSLVLALPLRALWEEEKSLFSVPGSFGIPQHILQSSKKVTSY